MIGQCISFPKSGRTWLRRMLEVAGCEKDVLFHHDGFEFNNGTRPPHDFDTAGRLRRYPVDAKIVYLERDPRDVMVSLYHQVTGRFRDFFGYEGDVSAFLRDDYFGARVLARFRAMWVEILTQRDFLHVRYEDMHADAGAVLRRVLDYLGAASDEARLEAAVEAGHVDRMRELERKGHHPEPWLRLRNGSPKVRRGEMGSFRTELGADDIAFLDDVLGRAG